MAVNPKSEDGLALRKLFPLYTMPVQRFKELCSDCDMTEIPEGRFLFNLGDLPDSFIYLIKGEVLLEGDDLKLGTIKAGTDAAKFALAHQFPRKVSARALDNVSFIRLGLNVFDKSEIDYNEQANAYRVESDEGSETDATVDWLAALLQSPLFRRLPAVNLQQVLRSLEDINFTKGQLIFKQGDTADYCYLIREGCCSLSQKATDKVEEISNKEISEGEIFGEQAVLTGELRNMTATAVTDMFVSRIDAQHFIKFIKEPTVNYIDYKDLDHEREQKPAPLIIDLRSAEEYKKNHIEGSQNIPFIFLSKFIKELINEPGKIIMVCADGSTSDAAAFELIKQGKTTFVLSRGMRSLPKKVVETANETEEVAQEDVEQTESNSGVQHEIQQLKAENERLLAEVELFKKQYRLLYKQTERLKAALDKLQAK